MLSEKAMLGSVVLSIIVAIVGATADIAVVTLVAVVWFGATMLVAQRGVPEQSPVSSATLSSDI